MQPIVFVTGKGGVGKTYAAALMAAKYAHEGKKTLLVEMGNWSYVEKALELPFKVGFEPQKTPYGFFTALWTGEECLRDYIQFLVKVPWVSEQFLKNSWLRALIQVAPGLKEISFLGKLTSGLRQHGPPLDFDVIIVDAVSSGHFVNLIKTPAALASVAPRGPMRIQCEGIINILNSDKVSVAIVTNLEAYSVSESFELSDQLKGIIKCPQMFVANKVYPVPVAPEPALLSAALTQAGPNATALENFLNVQFELGHFQWQQREKFSRQNKNTKTVWFYFDELKEMLKDTDELERLF